MMRGRRWLFAAVALAAWPALADAQALRLRFLVGEIAPYTGKGLAGNGLACAIVDAACEAAGLEAEFVFVPWTRAQSDTAAGKAFGTFPFLRLPEREGAFYYSKPLFSSPVSILRLRSNGKTAGFDYTGDPRCLVGYRVGTINGVKGVVTAIKEAGGTVEQVETIEQCLAMLRIRRIDLFINERVVIEDGIRRAYPGSSDLFAFTATDFRPAEGYHVLVSKAYPSAALLLERFDRGLEAIRADGRLAALYARFGLFQDAEAKP